MRLLLSSLAAHFFASPSKSFYGKKISGKRFKPIFFLFFAANFFASLLSAAAPWADHGPLRVSASGHSLEHSDGTAFFPLADTAWHLLTLPEKEIEVYLSDRSAKGFNVVMADFHADEKSDQDAEWQLGDAVVERAATHGLYVAIVAGWGDAFRNHTLQQMRECGQRLAARYQTKPNIIYIAAAEFYKIKGKLDGTPLNSQQIEALDQLGQGIRSVDKEHLITIHGFPDRGAVGQPSSYFQQSTWCDFYAVQTHQFQALIRSNMSHDWNLTSPTKPTLNAEGGYEGADTTLHPWLRKKSSVKLFDSAWGQRFQAYWSVFFGGCGYAYGHDYLWHMRDPQGRAGVLHRPALAATGAASMRHLRTLMEPRIATATPDRSLILSDHGTDNASDTSAPPDLCCATRASDRQWALIYTTLGKSFTLDLSQLTATQLRARWFDPRHGTYHPAGDFVRENKPTFDPPGAEGKDCDWILVLDAREPPR
jgi:hypothetical protein